MQFVIYDDHKEFIKIIENVIKEIKNDNDTITSFTEYNKDLSKIISSSKKKIYILDIEVPNSISGLELARKIRMTDWESVIIMITSHSELGYEALKAQIMLLDFISKFSPTWKTNLKSTIKKAMLKIKENPVIVLETPTIIHRIYTDDILYILKDSVERKCEIKTINDQFFIAKNIKDFEEILDKRFFKSHRSCYVNLNQIEKVDLKKSIIYFKNDVYIDYLARDKKKELKEYVRNN